MALPVKQESETHSNSDDRGKDAINRISKEAEHGHIFHLHHFISECSRVKLALENIKETLPEVQSTITDYIPAL